MLINDFQDPFRFVPQSDHRVAPYGSRQFRRDQFSFHPASTQTTSQRFRTDQFPNLFYISNFRHPPRGRYFPRVVFVESIDVGQEEQVIGVTHSRCDR